MPQFCRLFYHYSTFSALRCAGDNCWGKKYVCCQRPMTATKYLRPSLQRIAVCLRVLALDAYTLTRVFTYFVTAPETHHVPEVWLQPRLTVPYIRANPSPPPQRPRSVENAHHDHRAGRQHIFMQKTTALRRGRSLSLSRTSPFLPPAEMTSLTRTDQPWSQSSESESRSFGSFPDPTSSTRDAHHHYDQRNDKKC